MKLLLKFPTRGRPRQFLTTLNGWIESAANPANLAVLVSYDEDDSSMTPAVIAEAEKLHPSLIAVRGKSESKIHACNRDLPEYAADWDVVLLVSDDMWNTCRGWDNRIRDAMQRYFPDTDGALWFYDSCQTKINTLECVGRKRYAYFGYLYHNSYKSFWCDNETTAVGVRDKKLVMIEQPICKHQHPSWGRGMQNDATYQKNHPFWKQDEANFYKRQATGFPK